MYHRAKMRSDSEVKDSEADDEEATADKVKDD
jgi:hypothetical protein